MSIVPDDETALDAYFEQMDQKIQEGRVDVTLDTEVKIPKNMKLSWALENGSIDERTSIGPSPKITFLDANNEEINVGTMAEPWKVRVNLVDSQGNDESSHGTLLQGSTEIGAYGGVAEFSDIYVPSNSHRNKQYKLNFSVVSPAEFAAKAEFTNKLSTEFIINERQVSAQAVILNHNQEIEEGELIQYRINLLDGNGNILQDSNWKGWTWYVETNPSSSSSDTLIEIPATGDATIDFDFSSTGLTKNHYYKHTFIVSAYDSNGNLAAGSRLIIESDPLLIVHNLSDLADYTFVQHFALVYKTLSFSSIQSIDHLISDFHNKLQKADQNDFYIGQIEIYQGSIIVEGTAYAKTQLALTQAMDHIMNEALKAEQFSGLTFVIEGECDMTTSENRVLGLKTEDSICFAGLEDDDGLQGWAIALIVVCSIVAIVAVIFLVMVCSNQRKKKHLHLVDN